jgi:hypothetical protein
MDSDHIQQLISIGGSVDGFADAQATAKQNLPGFPHNGCAATLSALLGQAGIDVPMTLGAGHLAEILEGDRGWQRIAVGEQQPGDVGVTFDNSDPPGADHIYLVVEALDEDEMVIADNQATVTHQRFASGHGKTATEYFLRA